MARRWAGGTVKLSISLATKDVALLKKRAKRVGSISAAISETIRLAGEEDGREALAAWLSEGRGELTEEEMESIRAEWRECRLLPRSRRTRAA
jgi:hypothetical protein